MLTECRIFLPWAAKKLELMGGHIEQTKINSFSEISERFNVVVNCTGLGAKKLCNDYKLVPIRGQILKVFHVFNKTYGFELNKNAI